MPTISLNDADFYYETHGQGAPLVLISGYTCDHQLWLPVLDKLAKHYTVILFDNRGVGRTKDGSTKLSVELMASDVAALIRELGFEKAHVGGSSMGGTIAQAVAAQHPEVVDKLVLMVTSAKWRVVVLKYLYAMISLRQKEADFDSLFDLMLPWVFGEAFINDEQQVSLLKEGMETAEYPQSLQDQARQFEVLSSFDGRDQLPKIRAETLVAYGVEDIISLPGDSAYLAEHIANATLKSFPGAHGISSEAPTELTDAMIEFLG